MKGGAHARITIKVSPTSGYHGAVTRRVPSVDPRLLAILRGEIQPDDPFGGLRPAYEEIVPRLLVHEQDLVGFSDDPRDGFVLCQIDGRRTLAEIADACALGLDQTFEILDDLAMRGVVQLV